jgi:DNA invertase Pin-like site-specific DNA recombinase
MKIGYARVSTEEQNLDLQLRALNTAGCKEIITDHGFSGAQADRPGLARTLCKLAPGDTMVVWRLDRLGRSLPHLIAIINDLHARGIGLESVCEQIDTSSPAGRFYLHMLAALAEFERELIRDRTNAGLAAARARGVTLGRPRKLSPTQARKAARRLKAREKLESIASEMGISAQTLRRVVERLKNDGAIKAHTGSADHRHEA